MLDDREFWNIQRGEQFPPGAAVEVHDGDGLAERAREEERGGVVARGHVPLAGADEDAVAGVRRLGEIPARVVHRVGRGDELGAAGSGGLVNGDEVGGAGKGGVGAGADFAEGSDIFRGAELRGDLVEARFLERDGDGFAGAFQLGQGARAFFQILPQQQEDAFLFRRNGTRAAVEAAVGAGGIAVVVDRRMSAGVGRAGAAGEVLRRVAATWV